jgi:hypothetical protein
VFKVRREQMEAYREAALRDFEGRVVEHVARCFPDRLATLGEDGLRRMIRAGVERAGVHGVVAARDVCKFIDLMLVFGVNFDREREWAREILDAKGDPFKKMRRLFGRALEEA